MLIPDPGSVNDFLSYVFYLDDVLIDITSEG